MLRWIMRILVAIVVAAGALLLGLVMMTRSSPSWYQPPPADDAKQATLADKVEYRLVEETQKIRPEDEPWTLRVREEHFNAWLATRLPDWIASEQNVRWPDELGTPQVRIELGTVSLALPVGPPDHQRVVIATIQPFIAADELWLSLDGLRIGRLAVPGDPINTLLRLARENAVQGESVDRLLALLSAEEPIPPFLTLADGREVRLLEIACGRDQTGGYLDLKNRTLNAAGVSSENDEKLRGSK